MTSIREQVKAVDITQVLKHSGKTHSEQKFATEWRESGTGKTKERCRAFVRLDDDCGNRHDSFSITGETQYWARESWSYAEEAWKGRWKAGNCGCIHEDVAKFFPELAPFIKWHLTSTDEPMHYLANATYHASDKDRGYRKGEACAWEKSIQFGEFPITIFKPEKFIAWLADGTKTDAELAIVELTHTDAKGYVYRPSYTFKGCPMQAWAGAPFNSLREAQEFREAVLNYPVRIATRITAYSEGKVRNLDAARNAAVWPEATDEELCSDNLKELLEARLPSLRQAFREDMEKLGFVITEGERK